MIVVTGGAGFIGSNVVGALNSRGRDDVVVVDDMTDGRKFVNLVGRRIADYFDKDDFLGRLKSRAFGKIDAIFHQGACAVTTEWNGRYVLETNYRYSVDLLDYCLANGVPLIYASSAAVYGASTRFNERDADVERRICLGRIDQERGRLLSALVAARGFARFKRRDQPFSEGAAR